MYLYSVDEYCRLQTIIARVFAPVTQRMACKKTVLLAQLTLQIFNAQYSCKCVTSEQLYYFFVFVFSCTNKFFYFSVYAFSCINIYFYFSWYTVFLVIFCVLTLKHLLYWVQYIISIHSKGNIGKIFWK